MLVFARPSIHSGSFLWNCLWSKVQILYNVIFHIDTDIFPGMINLGKELVTVNKFLLQAHNNFEYILVSLIFSRIQEFAKNLTWTWHEIPTLLASKIYLPCKLTIINFFHIIQKTYHIKIVWHKISSLFIGNQRTLFYLCLFFFTC